jgi:diaminohydroxyphosphoribosylaminopyrimidine deaminase/5-amino-6-(5-phosphoribosylamino)uracil reductase
MSFDHDMLSVAARAALRSHGDVEPNPMVGCVLVRDGKILAVGHHRKYGTLHAERDALAACHKAGHDPAGATAYVTLEPCNGQGKQPPCTQALIEAKIARVVYAVRDPNPAKSGGVELLRSRGIVVDHVENAMCTRLSGPFLRTLSGMPWVTAKWAQTLDGRIATRTGQSQWISSKDSRRRVHRIRARVDAVLTGLGTVLADDPQLTARPESGARRIRRLATRVVVDSKLMTPVESKLAKTAREVPVLILTVTPASVDLRKAWDRRRDALESLGVKIVEVGADATGEVDLAAGLHALCAHGLTTVLVEAGPRLLGSLLNERLIDEAIVHLAPMIMGDPEARPVATGRPAPNLTDASRWELLRSKRVGPDLELLYWRM